MAIQTIQATIQMRQGDEDDFDPDQMTAGEWAVSTDTKKVWMCFLPGFVLRMATYEAFEADMEEIREILQDCQSIKAAVQIFMQIAAAHENNAEIYSKESKSWAVGGTGIRDGEDTDNSKYYSEQSKVFLLQTEQAGTDAISSVEAAKNEALEAITDASGLVKPEFSIDTDNGHLYYTASGFDFNVNQNNGHLEVSIV